MFTALLTETEVHKFAKVETPTWLWYDVVTHGLLKRLVSKVCRWSGLSCGGVMRGGRWRGVWAGAACA